MRSMQPPSATPFLCSGPEWRAIGGTRWGSQREYCSDRCERPRLCGELLAAPDLWLATADRRADGRRGAADSKARRSASAARRRTILGHGEEYRWAPND